MFIFSCFNCLLHAFTVCSFSVVSTLCYYMPHVSNEFDKPYPVTISTALFSYDPSLPASTAVPTACLAELYTVPEALPHSHTLHARITYSHTLHASVTFCQWVCALHWTNHTTVTYVYTTVHLLNCTLILYTLYTQLHYDQYYTVS